MTDYPDLEAALAAPFDPHEVKWKPQAVKNNRAMAIAYVDARVVQDRLDEVLGVSGWSDTYDILADGSVTCRLSCRMGDQWIVKQDVGSPSEQPDAGDRLKSAFSDALKRAAVKFGVGRYLYRLPIQWVEYDPQRRQFVKTPTLPASASALPKTQAAPREKPAPASQEPAAPGLPKTGAECQQRLKAADARYAGEGRCKPGALLAFVEQEMHKGGFPLDATRWNNAAIVCAVGATKAFLERHPPRAKHRQGDASESAGPASDGEGEEEERASPAQLLRIDDLLRQLDRTRDQLDQERIDGGLLPVDRITPREAEGVIQRLQAAIFDPPAESPGKGRKRPADGLFDGGETSGDLAYTGRF